MSDFSAESQRIHNDGTFQTEANRLPAASASATMATVAHHPTAISGSDLVGDKSTLCVKPSYKTCVALICRMFRESEQYMHLLLMNLF